MKVPKPRKMTSGNYYIQLRLGGKSVGITAPSEKECIRQAQYVKSEYLAGRRSEPQEDPTPKLPTLGEAVDKYIDDRASVLSPATVRGYRTIRRARFTTLMDKSLSDISPDQWQQAVNLEAKTCSGKTLKNAWGLLVSVVTGAAGSPPPRVKLPQVITNERLFLEPEQIRPFISAVHNTPAEIPALLALHSLRRSEIAALTWDNIDLENDTIRVKGAAVPNEFHVIVQKKENKNASSARTVPILITELHDALAAVEKKEGLVVTCNPNTILSQINRVCAKNGLPKIGTHGLRHSFVSLAYHLGVPEKVTMELGGWSDYQTMRKIYTHIARSDVTKYTRELKNFFSPSAKKENAPEASPPEPSRGP